MQTPTAATNAVAVCAGNGDSAVAVTFGAVQTVTRLDVEHRREEAMAIFAPLRERYNTWGSSDIIQYGSSRILYYTYYYLFCIILCIFTGGRSGGGETGVTKFGVANYEGTAKLKVKAPAQRPALMPPPQAEAMEDEPMPLM